MSLDYYLADIENWKDVCEVPSLDQHGKQRFADDGAPLVRMNPMTESLIWALMAIGKSSITKKNVAEVYMRLHVYESMFGSFLMENGNDRPFTPDDVKAHIGLRTNVTNTTPAVFYKSLLEGTKRDYELETEDETT